MIVLVNLKGGVSPEEYERWVLESYAPAVSALPSVSDWRNHRVSGLLGSETTPPYRYVVTLDFGDGEALGRDMARKEMGRLLEDLHRLADVTQLLADRFV